MSQKKVNKQQSKWVVHSPLCPGPPLWVDSFVDQYRSCALNTMWSLSCLLPPFPVAFLSFCKQAIHIAQRPWSLSFMCYKMKFHLCVLNYPGRVELQTKSLHGISLFQISLKATTIPIWNRNWSRKGLRGFSGSVRAPPDAQRQSGFSLSPRQSAQTMADSSLPAHLHTCSSCFSCLAIQKSFHVLLYIC